MSKDVGGVGLEVFTVGSTGYQVKVNVIVPDLRQAMALRRIITAFQTSMEKDRRLNGQVG